MTLPTWRRVLDALEAIAPLHLAAEWDNVGLLIEPPARARTHRQPVSSRDDDRLHRLVLTIDLTAAVLDEAIEQRADLIVAYHPPWFAPLKSLSIRRANERTLLRAAQEGIGLYSPHTALDAAEGGVNDWLAEAFGECEVAAIHSAWSESQSEDEDDDTVRGQGRLLVPGEPLPLSDCLRRVKEHLRCKHLRVAMATRHRRDGEPIRSIALVPGAGGDVLMEICRSESADLLFTGEMRHHDVLAAVEGGVSVILAEHSHTERGYLPRLKSRLLQELGSEIAVVVATADAEPLAMI
jgi:dinuclear metal center YbgI/SA1388 family protein